MADFYSKRFGKSVWITNHARASMVRRCVDVSTLATLLEEGEIKHRDATNLWVFLHIEGRADNLICAALVEQSAIVVKTVMVRWTLEDEL